MPRLTIRLPEDVVAALEAAAPPPAPGRTGGAAAIARLILCEWAGVSEPPDPHEGQGERLRGAPNPYHPAKR